MVAKVVDIDAFGPLTFLDRVSLPDPVRKTLESADVAHGAVAFLYGQPFVEMAATLRGLRDVGIEPGEVAISEILLDRGQPAPGNMSLIGVCAHIDTSGGPMVLDMPAGYCGIVVDAGFRIVTDIVRSGPERGDQARYLFLPPGDTGVVPTGYRVTRSTTFNLLVFLAVLSKHSAETKSWCASIKEQLNIYPLAVADNPPPEIFHYKPYVHFNSKRDGSPRFFEELNAVVQREAADAFSAEAVTALASIGIAKGHPFAPGERMARALYDADRAGHVIAKALALNPGKPGTFPFEGWSRTLSFGRDGQRRTVILERPVSPAVPPVGETNQSFCNLIIRSK